jgi:hypothetical protein
MYLLIIKIMIKNTLFDSLRKEDLAKLDLVKIKIKKEELTRFKFTKKEYDEILNYCTMLGYVSIKKEQQKNVTKNGLPVYTSPSMNNQGKTIKIFNSKTHRWGYLQKLKNGIFYGYFQSDEKGNSTFIPKYNFEANLNTFKLMLKMKNISLERLKIASGIMELELS